MANTLTKLIWRKSVVLLQEGDIAEHFAEMHNFATDGQKAFAQRTPIKVNVCEILASNQI